MMSHRGAASQAFMRELQIGLEKVFLTQRPVFISTSSATGLMEAAVRNAGRTRVLSLVNGAFSKRFADTARSCGLDVDEVEIPWGEAHDPGDVAARLHERSYDAVTMAHSETSTGVLNDVRSLASVVRDVSLSRYSQDHELEADQLGMRYLIRAGYDSHAALAMVRDFAQFDQQSISLFRTHPYTARRVQDLEQYLRDTSGATGTAAVGDLKSLKQVQQLYPVGSTSWKNLQRQIEAFERGR